MASSGADASATATVNNNNTERPWPSSSRRCRRRNEFLEIERLRNLYREIKPDNIDHFTDFPLSNNTLIGLAEANYFVPTEVQRDSIGRILNGADVCIISETGSGKTLTFLIPVLEFLYCNQYTQLDGMGALIITPTRELALQLFETLKVVGKYHNLSAGLIIGGKDLNFEMRRMGRCNIVIGTPGRLLHHMDTNPNVITTSLRFVVIDEADKLLDMGFAEQMFQIIEHLPAQRQTLLFSATQPRSISDLVDAGLRNAVYISTQENRKYVTPEALEQSYILCELQDKVSFLWSFLITHKKQKILVFFATSKEVKYFHALLCRLKVGIPLLALYGKLHQLRRMEIYRDFTEKQNVVLLATDLASRGLDFPNIDWVVHYDCPEDGETYIHRAGRTARYKRGGESLLVLLPSEERAMVEELRACRVPIHEISANPCKMVSPLRKMEALLAKDNNLKLDAQRAFAAYLKFVYLMRNKKIFRIEVLDIKKFALSLGLAVTPRVRFLRGKVDESIFGPRRERRDGSSMGQENETGNSDDDIDDDILSDSDSDEYPDSDLEEYGIGNKNTDDVEPKPGGSGIRNAVVEPKAGGSGNGIADFEPKPGSSGIRSNLFNFNNVYDDDDDDDDDDEILTVKRKDHEIDEVEEMDMTKGQRTEFKSKKMKMTKAFVAKKMFKKKIVPNKKIIFDEEGQVIHKKVNDKFSKEALEYEMEDKGGIDIQKARKMLRAEDKYDKQWFRERVKEKHKKLKQKLKKKLPKESDEEEDDPGIDDDNVPNEDGDDPFEDEIHFEHWRDSDSSDF